MLKKDSHFVEKLFFLFLIILPLFSVRAFGINFREGLPEYFHFKEKPIKYFYHITSIPPSVILDPNRDWIGIFIDSDKCIGGGPWRGTENSKTVLIEYRDYPLPQYIRDEVVFRIWKANKKKIFDAKASKSKIFTENGYGIDLSDVVPLGMTPMTFEITFENKVRVANNELKYALWFIKEKQQALRHSILFKKLWHDVINGFGDIPPVIFQKDVHWFNDLKLIKDCIDKAEIAINNGLFQQARNEINIIRFTVANLRSRNRVIHFGDIMLSFEKTLEEVSGIFEHKRLNALKKNSWTKLGELMPELYLACLNIKSFIPKDLSEEDKGYFSSLGKELEMGIKKLLESVEQRDSIKFEKSLKEVKRIYWAYYLMFG